MNTAARISAALLILSSIAMGLMVVTRLAADADQPTIEEAMLMISSNNGMYIMSGASRVASAIFLLAAVPFLWWVIRQRRQMVANTIAVLFSASALFTIVSGAYAIGIGSSLRGESHDYRSASTPSTINDDLKLIETFDDIKSVTGKAGFTLAGMAIIAFAMIRRRAGASMKWLALIDAAIGIGMLFIWVDAATVLHRVTGAAFFLWLILNAVWLFKESFEKKVHDGNCP